MKNKFPIDDFYWDAGQRVLEFHGASGTPLNVEDPQFVLIKGKTATVLFVLIDRYRNTPNAVTMVHRYRVANTQANKSLPVELDSITAIFDVVVP